MLIGKNPLADPKEFEMVLKKGKDLLDDQAKTSAKYFLDEKSDKFEDMVFEVLRESAKGSQFDNCIHLLKGHAFPDIVFRNRYYGVEVKSLKHAGWSTPGNSIFEGTRVEDVERIYLLAGRLSDPVEFKFGKYEDCIDDIQITHSPRYHIDMNIKNGETIFKRLKISYDEFRSLENPVKLLKPYYKEKLKPGESLWWLDDEDVDEKILERSYAVKIFNDLKPVERNKIIAESFAKFPILLSRNQTRYKKVASWLIAEKGYVSHNLRDSYSSKGTVTIEVNNKPYSGVPKIFGVFKSLLKEIQIEIEQLKSDVIQTNWNVEDSYGLNRFEKWVEIVDQSSREMLRKSGLPLRKMIFEELIK